MVCVSCHRAAATRPYAAPPGGNLIRAEDAAANAKAKLEREAKAALATPPAAK